MGWLFKFILVSKLSTHSDRKSRVKNDGNRYISMACFRSQHLTETDRDSCPWIIIGNEGKDSRVEIIKLYLHHNHSIKATNRSNNRKRVSHSSLLVTSGKKVKRNKISFLFQFPTQQEIIASAHRLIKVCSLFNLAISINIDLSLELVTTSETKYESFFCYCH